MRAYKFLCREYGVQSLKERRLKQSTVNDLNDPFELTPYDLTDPAIRATFIATRNNMHEDRGLLCFSADWNDPVIWAHYSEKHLGICLGFEIPEMTGDPQSDCDYVKYVDNPHYFDFHHYEELAEQESTEVVRKILFTK